LARFLNAISKYDESAKKAERFNDRISEITGVRTELIESRKPTGLQNG